MGYRLNILSDGKSGVGYVAWVPANAPAKNGGIFTSSPFTDGSQLVMKTEENAIETFELVIHAASQDMVLAHRTNLVNYLNRSIRFFTGRNQPAYDSDNPNELPFAVISAVGSCESETRYAIVKDFDLVNTSDYYTSSFKGDGYKVALEATLVIHRGAWQSVIPGKWERLYANSLEDEGHMDSVGTTVVDADVGIERTTQPIPIANYWAGLGWTDFYTYDQSAGAYSTNLLDATPPYDLFPVPSTTLDFLYFAITTEGGRFSGGTADRRMPNPNTLVLYLDQSLSLNVEDLSLGFEYLDNAGAWQPLTAPYAGLVSRLGGFTADEDYNTYYFSWERPSDLGYRNLVIGAVNRTGYWYRVAVNANADRVRVTKPPWASMRNYIKFDGQDLTGDKSTLLRLISTGYGASGNYGQRIILGLRSQDRIPPPPIYPLRKNWYFQSWWTSTNYQMFWLWSGGGATWHNQYEAHTNQVAGAAIQQDVEGFHSSRLTQSYLPGAGTQLDQSHTLWYFLRLLVTGKFRCFLCARQRNGDIGTVSWRIKTYNYYATATPAWTSRTITHKILDEWELLDFGEIRLPPSLTQEENTDISALGLLGELQGGPSQTLQDALRVYHDYINHATDTVYADVKGLILIPTDEWFADIYWPSDDSTAMPGEKPVIIDSVSPQRTDLTVKTFLDRWPYYSTGKEFPLVDRNLVASHVGPMALRQGKEQYLHFLWMNRDASTGAWLYTETDHGLWMTMKANRYTFARGDQ